MQRRSRSPSNSSLNQALKPEEDWTKISDLAERRRIQNRIAQRNYRKKQKKRLEDLERRAGSSPPSDAGSPPELSPQLQPDYILSDDHDIQLHEAYPSFDPNYLSTSEVMFGNSFDNSSQPPIPQKSPRHRHSLQERPNTFEMHGRSLSDPLRHYPMPQITLGNVHDTLLQDDRPVQYEEQSTLVYPSPWLLQHGFNHEKLNGGSDPTLALSQPIDSFMLNVPSLAIDSQDYMYDSFIPTSMPWESPSWGENDWSSRATTLTNMTNSLHTPPLSTNGDGFRIKDEYSKDCFNVDGRDIDATYEDTILWADVWK